MPGRSVPRLLIVISFILFLSSCQLFPRFECNPDESYARKADLPPTAADVQERCSGLHYEVTFKMAAEDLAAFQMNSPIQAWRVDNSSDIFAEPPFAEQAARASQYLYGEFSNGIDLINVLIDMSDGRVYTVYYDADYVD
ncbi:MAG: hypothetical protein KC547_08750 [Anaerolineae bacterium]|nr:hypothetical protein [Anaerolineae bacterium]MCA9911270.1 hypothetical protein [Anaerolineae bacterium]